MIDIQQTDEAVELVQRVCALDIGKAALTVCIQVPHPDKPGHRRQEVQEHATTTRSLLALAARLHAAGVRLVAMQATSDDSEAGVVPAGSRRIHLLAAQRQARPGTSPAAPRPTSPGAVWLAKVAWAGQVPAKLRAATADPAVA